MGRSSTDLIDMTRCGLEPGTFEGALVRPTGWTLDVIGHEAAAHGLDRDGTSNQLGRELDELAEAIGLDEP